MGFQRILVFIFSILFSTLTVALPKGDASNAGLALVHGTKDHREDAYGTYWKLDFIETLSHALDKPENLFVAHCDFSQYMWHDDSANCLADQLLDFISEKNIESLTVITHSDGANVMRWILSNPTYDSRYLKLKNKIKKVIALAPSSGGTPLADEVLNGGVFETSLAWLLGYLSDAVKQQRVGDMLIFNDELLLGGVGRPSLSIPFKTVIGTDVSVSPFSSSSYCNGYMLNSGLKIAKLFLDECADGFLNCESQTHAGDVWFYDVDKTENNSPLSHNQSRHSCLGLEYILISEIAKKGIV
jgi:hypothetical protein